MEYEATWQFGELGEVIDIHAAYHNLFVLTKNKIAVFDANGIDLFFYKTIPNVVDGFRVVELGDYWGIGEVLVRTEVGNVYVCDTTDERFELIDTGVLSITRSGELLKQSGSAYSTTMKRVVPLYKGDLLNVFCNDWWEFTDIQVKQKADGSFVTNPFVADNKRVLKIDDKVVKIITMLDGEYKDDKTFYLTTDGTLKRLDGVVIATNVTGFGNISYYREGYDKDHPLVDGRDGIWYEKDGKLHVYGANLKFHECTDVCNYEYWWNNSCANEILIAYAKGGEQLFYEDYIFSKFAPEYVRV